MANRLQLKRGSGAPGSIFYAGEPIFDQSGKILYVGDTGGTGTGVGSSIASANTYLAALEMLQRASTAASGSVRLYEDTDNGSNYVAIAASAALGANYTFTLPDTAGSDGQVLKTDGSGNLAWVNQTSGYSGWSISDGTNTESILNNNTVNIVSGIGITAVVSATDTLTIAAKAASATNAGIASFSSTDFYFTNTYQVGINTESIQDMVGSAINAGINTNITVTYDDANNRINYNVNTATSSVLGVASFNATDFTVSTGSVTLNSIANNKLANSTIGVTDGTTSTNVALGSTITFSGTANETTVSQSAGTVTIGLPDNVTIGNDLTINGNLRVVGIAVTFETQVVKIEDRLIELGLINGATDPNTTWDLGVAFNYGDGTAKKSGIFWIDNQYVGVASAISVTNDTGATDADPQISITTFAPLVADGLYLGGFTAGDLVINSVNEAVNLTFDGGTF